MFNLDGDIVYDIETYPSVFTAGFRHLVTGREWLFEISYRRNDTESFLRFMKDCTGITRWVGFNNMGFDYPVLHALHNNPKINIYGKAMDIINSDDRFEHVIWDNKQLVRQLDLYRIHHFDNNSKRTSLKWLEFNMRMNSVEGLPFPPGTHLKSHEIDTLIEYMWHDIDATEKFYHYTTDLIKLRESLDDKFLNKSDVKMGEMILIDEMEKRGISCYDQYKNKKQTIRKSIDLSEVIFDYVQFENPEFQRIKEFLASKTITETKGVFKGLNCIVDGVKYVFGTGGLHASVESQTVLSRDDYQIVDIDVASFYPNMAIVNKLYPEHLGVEFCDAYLSVYETRKTFGKGTAENGAYKLALNGAYGGSNNEYSPFFDSKYTMSITINGQLMLCMLAEHMLKIPGLKMIQGNTDGITFLCPRQHLDHSREVCKWWEGLTGLELEEVLYSRMFIRDVNSYIAETEEGKVKRIGCYAHEMMIDNLGTRELAWHKNWSARIVAIAAEALLVHGVPIAETIGNHKDMYDFLLCTKVPKSSALEHGGVVVQNVSRYYISNDGAQFEKVMPPKGTVGEFKRANKLTDKYFNSIVEPGVWDERIHTKNKSTYQIRRIGINTGYNVTICDKFDSHEFDINYAWYIKEAEAITLPLMGVSNGSKGK